MAVYMLVHHIHQCVFERKTSVANSLFTAKDTICGNGRGSIRLESAVLLYNATYLSYNDNTRQTSFCQVVLFNLLDYSV
jgi:hypothetical protein